METNPIPQVRKRPSFLKIFLIVLMVLLVVGAGTAYFGWTWYQAQLQPVSDSPQQILVNVPQGASSAAVGEILAEAGVINNSTVFRIWLRYQELDGKIQAGEYVLNPAQSLAEIVDKLVQGDVHREILRFTIPEGLFLTDIAARLAEQEIVDEERFLELVADTSLWQDYWFVQELPEGMETPLEGYLFPETYEIDAQVEDREELIIAKLLNQFEKVFTQEMRERAEELDMTVHEVVTLASIVEKEAVVNHERPLIAGVFHNRLGISMPLQSCATVNYVLGDFSIRYLSDEQLKTPSPYNTYQNQGLPPGPIAGAGRSAIESVLWPEETGYHFFVAKDDGSGEHYFADTFAEHQRNIKKARENRS